LREELKLEQSTKKRIIGLGVLASLGMILIPVIFSNKIPADERVNNNIQLPEPPTLPNFEDKKVVSVPEPVAVVRDTVEIPEVWVVQLGVFKDQANAAKLIQDLRDKGFPAFTKLTKAGEENAIHVFIGPEIDRQRAAEVALRLEKSFQIHGMVVRHKL
jgi:cell division septation protein DedD